MSTASFDAVCLVSDEGVITQPSRSLTRMTGVAGDGLVGQPLTGLLAPHETEGLEQAWERARDTREPTSCRADLRTPTGDRSCDLLLEPAPVTGGSTIVLIRREDSTRRADRHARLLRRVTEAANDTSTTTDLFARAVADIRRTMDWPVGRVWIDTDDEAGLRLQTVDGAPTGEQRHSDAAVKARSSLAPVATPSNQTASSSEDGARPGAAVAVPVVADGEAAAVLEFLAPEPVELDADLTALLTALGRQLGSVVERERARVAMDEQARELERSNDELEQFAYVASHDLQEPLRKIVGFSELLEQRYDEHLDETGREYLGYVVDGARRMRELIQDLLAYSRAGRTEPAIESVDLGTLVERVLETLQWKIEDTGTVVTVNELPTVMGDATLLSDVLTNLLTNAIKYTEGDGARIDIAARVADDGQSWEMTVADDGIGIAPERAEQIFVVFRRLHSAAQYPGTGIGLAITRRFVEAHGGRIWVTPNQPAGSVFHFTIPARAEEP